MSEDSEARTKYGDRIADDHWEPDDDLEEQPDQQAIEVDHHLIIKDERDAIERYNGLEWRFLFEDGYIVAVDKSHYCPGPGHTDPMGFRAWDDVPRPVRKRVLQQFRVDEPEQLVDIKACAEVAEDQFP